MEQFGLIKVLELLSTNRVACSRLGVFRLWLNRWCLVCCMLSGFLSSRGIWRYADLKIKERIALSSIRICVLDCLCVCVVQWWIAAVFELLSARKYWGVLLLTIKIRFLLFD